MIQSRDCEAVEAALQQLFLAKNGKRYYAIFSNFINALAGNFKSFEKLENGKILITPAPTLYNVVAIKTQIILECPDMERYAKVHGGKAWKKFKKSFLQECAARAVALFEAGDIFSWTYERPIAIDKSLKIVSNLKTMAEKLSKNCGEWATGKNAVAIQEFLSLAETYYGAKIDKTCLEYRASMSTAAGHNGRPLVK